MIKHVRRWLPDRWLVLVVNGGFAVVSLALTWVKHQVTRVSRLRGDAAWPHPPGPRCLAHAAPTP